MKNASHCNSERVESQHLLLIICAFNLSRRRPDGWNRALRHHLSLAIGKKSRLELIKALSLRKLEEIYYISYKTQSPSQLLKSERRHNESVELINLFHAILKYFSSRAPFSILHNLFRAQGIPSSDFKLLD
jgi:hypothetical protein